MKKLHLIIISLLIPLSLVCDEIEDYPYYKTYTGIDYLVVRYYWTTATGGIDLDTRTAIVNPPRNADVGWARGGTDSVFLEWGGDNTSNGYEAVLVNIKELANQYSGDSTFRIRLRAFWYSTPSNGDINIEFTGYHGGVMARDGYNWVNQGGELLSQVTVNRNIVANTPSDLDGDDAGIARYNVRTEELEILDPE